MNVKEFFLESPVFLEDENKTRKGKILTIVLLNYWLIVVIAISFLFLSVQKLAVAFLTILFASFLLLIGLIKQKGNIDFASKLLIIGVWCLITIACIFAGTSVNAFSCWYISLIIVVGLLQKRKETFIFSAFTIFTATIILFLNIEGYFDNPYFPVPPLVSLVVFIIAIVQSFSPLIIGIQSLSSLSELLEGKVHERTNQLEMANNDLELYTSFLSHDLKNSVQIIDGLLISMDEYKNEFSPPMQELFSKAKINSNRMNELTRNLLQYFSTNNKTVNKSKLNMNDIINHVLDNFSLKSTVKFEIDNLPDCFGDSLLLTEAWINLISNAIKFTKDKDNPTIKIGYVNQENEIVYYIKDNGIGIDQANIGKIFKPFQRVHENKGYEGFGIGLAFVHSIISKHGGKIWVESVLGKGSTFYFTL